MLTKLFLYVTLIMKLTIFIRFALAQEEYFPLQIGNQWTYDFHWQDFNNNTIDSVFTNAVIDSFNGCFRFSSFPSPTTGDSILFKSDNGKVLRYHNGKFLVWYDFIAEVGDSLLIPIRQTHFSTDTTDILCVVTSKTDTFFVGRDTLLNCYRYKFSYTRPMPDILPWEELFAPNVGLVEHEFAGLAWGYYRFKGGVINGLEVSVDENMKGQPPSFVLSQNYPNPFNSASKINYNIATGAMTKVQLKVFDIRGRTVRTLVDSNQPAGYYQVVWNGKDDNGRDVSSGIYLCVLRVKGFQQNVKKMVLIK